MNLICGLSLWLCAFVSLCFQFSLTLCGKHRKVRPKIGSRLEGRQQVRNSIAALLLIGVFSSAGLAQPASQDLSGIWAFGGLRTLSNESSTQINPPTGLGRFLLHWGMIRLENVIRWVWFASCCSPGRWRSFRFPAGSSSSLSGITCGARFGPTGENFPRIRIRVGSVIRLDIGKEILSS